MEKQEPREIVKLRALREEKGLSYPDLAFSIGVNPMTVYSWLKGRGVPSKMARTLINQFLAREKR